MPEAWLDVALVKCPKCGKLYVDAAWYCAEIGADVECSVCGETFNTKSNLLDRVLVKFSVENDKIAGAEVVR